MGRYPDGEEIERWMKEFVSGWKRGEGERGHDETGSGSYFRDRRSSRFPNHPSVLSLVTSLRPSKLVSSCDEY